MNIIESKTQELVDRLYASMDHCPVLTIPHEMKGGRQYAVYCHACQENIQWLESHGFKRSIPVRATQILDKNTGQMSDV